MLNFYWKSGEAEEDCCEENWMVGGKLAHLCDYLWRSTLDFDYLNINKLNCKSFLGLRLWWPAVGEISAWSNFRVSSVGQNFLSGTPSISVLDASFANRCGHHLSPQWYSLFSEVSRTFGKFSSRSRTFSIIIHSILCFISRKCESFVCFTL